MPSPSEIMEEIPLTDCAGPNPAENIYEESIV
jgi:hypothetical protein